MNRIGPILVILAAAAYYLFVGVVVFGQPCRPGQVCNTPVVTTAVVATPTVVLPVYGAVYAPSYGGGMDETNRLLAEMLAEQKALRAELNSMKGNAVAVRDPKPMLKANCARCHTAGQLAEGTDFEIFRADGELRELSGIDKRAIDKKLRNGTMPPPQIEAGGLKVQKMNAADRSALATDVTNMPTVAKPQPKEVPPPVPQIPASLPEPAVPSVPKK